MKQPKLTRSQYEANMPAEAERLLREGEMPPLDKVLRAVEESRQKYRQRIADARIPVEQVAKQFQLEPNGAAVAA